MGDDLAGIICQAVARGRHCLSGPTFAAAAAVALAATFAAASFALAAFDFSAAFSAASLV